MLRFGKLKFSYKNKILFNNFDLTINDNSLTTIIGPNGCGKSTLMKILLGLVPYDGHVVFNDMEVRDNVKEIRKQAGILLENPNNQIISEFVFDNISCALNNMGLDSITIQKRVMEITQKLEIDAIINENISNLNNNQKQLVCLASALISEPKILILDEALSTFDPDTKEKVLTLLNELKKSMIIIVISHDIEDTLISDEVVVINKGKVLLQGAKEDIYANEKTLNTVGYSLPFMVELSNRLMFYGLIDHVIYDMKEMVDVLWQ